MYIFNTFIETHIHMYTCICVHKQLPLYVSYQLLRYNDFKTYQNLSTTVFRLAIFTKEGGGGTRDIQKSQEKPFNASFPNLPKDSFLCSRKA